MTINTKVEIAGTDYQDYKNLRINKSMSDSGVASNFTIMLDSPYGRHATSFSVGNEIKIYADKDATPSTNIFTGIVEGIVFNGKENTQTVTLRGRDYTTRLMDVTVEPTIYTNSEVSTIITDIVSNFVSDITTTNVDVTSTTLKRIAFNHTSVYDAFKQLAELSGFYFYVDEDKDLHFEQLDTSSSGLILDNTNISGINFDKTREGMANIVWVYGDRYLSAAPTQIFFSGTSQGSVFTMDYRPHNTQVQTNNTRPGSNLIGGIQDLVGTESISGTEYLVNFFDRNIILLSGTTIGYSTLLNTGGSIVINAQREIPIAKTGTNRTSILAYGPKSKVIQDKSIKDPNTALDILNSELEKSDPLNSFNIEVDGWYSLTPGQTVEITLDDFNIAETNASILSINYIFDKNRIQSEEVIRLTLTNKTIDITDQIRDIKKRLDALESADKSTSDFITRIEQGIGSVLIVGSRWEIKTRYLGSEFRLWDSTNIPPIMSGGTVRLGLLGSSTTQAGSVSYLLGSENFLNPFTIVTSGGYAYG